MYYKISTGLTGSLNPVTSFRDGENEPWRLVRRKLAGVRRSWS